MKLLTTHYKLQNENGISIIITVIILNLILVGTLAISKIFTGEIQNSRALYNSTAAYYAAESGIEYMLYDQLKNTSPVSSGQYNCPTTNQTTNQQFNIDKLSCSINITVIPAKTNPATPKTINIKSTGSYIDKDGEAKRKIEINLTTTTTTTTTP